MRLDSDTFREIADALVRNKSRSLLTGFGIFWGLFMLLFLLGGGKGVKAKLMETFEGFASNAVILVTQETSQPYKGMPEGRYWSFEMRDIERLRMLVPELDIVSPQIGQWGQTVVHGDYSFNENCSIKCINADYSMIETPKIKYGRQINQMDVLKESKVCVIGRRIYESLFPEGGDPCGQFIKAGSVYFQVIGVDYNSGNISVNGSAASTISIPITVGQKLYNRGKSLDIICATAKPGVEITEIEGKIRGVLGRQHTFNPKDESALLVLNTQQIFKLMDNLFRGVNFLLWLVGLGTLLAGAIGVSNIMMVTVRERTTEIGIRRAIGATPRNILSQIMLESVTLTLMAGSAGIVFAVLMLSLLEKIVAGGVFQIGFWTAILAALLLTALGVVAGLAPAKRAMDIKPVDAMRDE